MCLGADVCACTCESMCCGLTRRWSRAAGGYGGSYGHGDKGWHGGYGDSYGHDEYYGGDSYDSYGGDSYGKGWGKGKGKWDSHGACVPVG